MAPRRSITIEVSRRRSLRWTAGRARSYCRACGRETESLTVVETAEIPKRATEKGDLVAGPRLDEPASATGAQGRTTDLDEDLLDQQGEEE